MTFARPFAYNPGSLIPGTEQVGSLSIGAPTSGFTNNPQYWNGPDEELGYVIAQSVSGNTQPTEIPGVFASVGFFRSDLTPESFITLSETIAGRSFSSGSEAKTWLNDNGYWTSYDRVPNSWFFSQPEGSTPSILPAGGMVFSDDNFQVTYDWDLAVSIYFNITDSDGVTHSDYSDLELYGGTITLVQDTQTISFSGQSNNFQLIGGFMMASVNTTTIQSGVFVSGLPIIVFVQVNYPPTPTPSVTSTPTPTPTPFAPNSYFFFVGEGQSPQIPSNPGNIMFVDDNNLVTYDWDLAVSWYINITDSDGLSHPDYLDLETYGGTITMVQDTQTISFSGVNTCFAILGENIVNSINYFTIQSGIFVSGLPIIVSVQVNYPPTPTPTPTRTPTRTPRPTVTPTRTPRPTPTPTNTPYPPGTYKFYLAEGSGPVVPGSNGDMMLIVAGGEVITYNPNDSYEITFTAIDKSGTSHPEYNDLLTYGGTITLTQGANTYIASGESGFFTYTSTIVPYYSASYLDIIQPSPNPFVSGSPIYLTASVNYPPTPTPSVTSTPTPTPTPFAPNTYFFRYSEGEPVTLINENGDLEFGFESSVTFNPNNMDIILVYDIDKSGLSHPEYQDAPTYGAVITMTQGSNSVVLSAGTQGEASEWVYISGFNILQSNNPVLITPSANPFVFNSPINLVVTVNYP